MHFSDLGVAPTILRALEAAGYDTPTGVQAEAIPAAIAGRDLLVSAQTGSGKTAAFLLPALTKLSERSTGKGQSRPQRAAARCCRQAACSGKRAAGSVVNQPYPARRSKVSSAGS